MSSARTIEPESTTVKAPFRLGEWPRKHPWIWAYIGTVLMWLVISLVNGNVNIGILGAVFGLAPYLVLVGIGQMFVITLGNGNIDLTMPAVVTLSAFAATEAIGVTHGNLLVGFAMALAVGLVAALVNSGLILGLRVPPIIATLAAGLILQSVTNVVSGLGSASPNPALSEFTNAKFFGVSVLGVLCVGLASVFAFVLRKTLFGRYNQAIGQSIEAARLSGIPVSRVILGSYVVSAVFAAVAGALLGSFSSPDLALGDPYLLSSIAVVVLGGSLISGGRSNLPGIWGAAMFLLLLNALLNTLNINVASQNLVKGLLIILVLALVGTEKKR